MNNDKFDIEYIDVIQYLNKMAFNKQFINTDPNFEKLNKLSNDDYKKCEKSIYDIIKLLNQNIEANDYNKESLNISGYDGFERVQRELGLAPGLYPKYNYDSLVYLLNFKILNCYKLNNYLRIKANIIIGRNNKVFTNKFMDFTVILLLFNDQSIIEFVYIIGFINKNQNLNNLYLDNKYYDFKTFDKNKLCITSQNYNELMDKYNYQNQIMQTSINHLNYMNNDNLLFNNQKDNIYEN